MSWRGRKPGGYLLAACIVSTIWALTLAWQSTSPGLSDLPIFVVEVLRGGAWLSFLTVISARIGVSRVVLTLVAALWVGVLLAGLVLWIAADFLGADAGLRSVLIPGGLAISLAGLMLIEQLYRNSPPGTRWGVKAIALGLGGLYVYDLFLYSQGLLFGVLDSTTWMARGAVNSLFVPLIAVAAKRNPDWDLNVFVSRQVVFYTTSLVVVGLYLLLMSLGGYALLIYGGAWGGLARTVFLVGAGLVLVMLLFSSVLRAKLKVFLNKHFYQNKYDYREEWLRLVSTISGKEESSTRHVAIQAMAQIVQSPGGGLWVQDESQRSYSLVATEHIDPSLPGILVDDPLIRFVQEQDWLIDLRELKEKPDLYGNLEVPEWLSGYPGAWLIIPVSTRQELVGLVMLTEAPGTPKLNYEDRDLLKTVGNHIAVHLAQERSDSLLAEAQQFEAYNRLTAFLMHDLNNLIAQQSLIVGNAEKHKRNPDFVDDAIQTIANSVERMKRVMTQLKRGHVGQTSKPTNLKFVVSTAVDRCVGHEPVPTLSLNGVEASLTLDAEEFVMILVNLIRNAQDATPADGEVSVSLEQRDGRVFINVADNGSGMTPEFIRDHLFKPFDSTKGSQGMGIGAYQAREFARKLGGDVTVDSALAQGTTISIVLDVPEAAAATG